MFSVRKTGKAFYDNAMNGETRPTFYLLYSSTSSTVPLVITGATIRSSRSTPDGLKLVDFWLIVSI